MEQMTVAPDGTMYWCTRKANLLRYAPPYSTVDMAWKTPAGAGGMIFGIALDPTRNVLYAGDRATTKIYKVPLDATPPTAWISIPAGVNGLTLANDGTLYYVIQAGAPTGGVYRIGPTETMPTPVTTTPLADGNDITFGPDGASVYVTIWGTGEVVKLGLQNGKETSRMTVTKGVTHGDGIAFDSAGNMYFNAGMFFQLAPGSATPKMLAPTGGAGIEFGCGQLSCNDVFYSNGGATGKFTAPSPGQPVPWHK
jgi:sugar lactone lactonase YvrE